MLALRRITLDAFRNYDSATLTVTAQPVVMVGENGAGKTNFLEAISLLAPGRGMRRATLQEMQNKNIPRNWAVSFTAQTYEGEAQIGIGRDLENPDKRIIRVDGKNARSQTQLAEMLTLLWLTPDMDRLMAEGTSDRRKFMDRMVYALHPDHLTHYNRYEEALRSRNRLLQEPRFDESWMNALEDNMAKDGIALAAARLHWLAALSPFLAADPAPFPGLELHIEGLTEKLANEMPALDAEDAFRAALKENRLQDMASGTTHIGAHRSNLRVTHASKNCPADLCSSGEQKALLISLVLAQSKLLKHLKGSAPILLLDDIMAHLDEARRACLTRQLLDLNAQSWLSGTDAGFFKGFGANAQFFTLNEAHIRVA